MITQTGGKRIFFFIIVGVYVEFSVTVNEVTIYVLTVMFLVESQDTCTNQCVGTHTKKHTQMFTYKNNQTFSKTHHYINAVFSITCFP